MSTLRSLLTLVAVPLLLLGAVGCSAQSGEPGVRCLPALALDEDVVPPGAVLAVTGDSLTCELDFTEDRWLTLEVRHVLGGSPALVEQRVRAAEDGSFATELRLPADMSVGRAAVRVVSGYEAPCDDNGSCIESEVEFRVRE